MKGGDQYFGLKLCVIRDSQRTTQLKRNPKRPRRRYLLSVLSNQADLGGGNTLFLEIVPERANGTRAEGSYRYQQHTVHVILFEYARQITRSRFHASRICRTHE